MLLMATEEPGLTAADLAAGLQVSPAAVFNAVRYLGEVPDAGGVWLNERLCQVPAVTNTGCPTTRGTAG